MLLMDGLLNFSKEYLPDKRGGQMDAPLVMSSRIDPSEIDDEAHNMDIVRRYPEAFYEATLEMADPGEVEDLIQLGEDTLGTDDEYRGFDHTHDTTDIALGPDLSAYKTLGSMMDKMDAQLELARKLRAVDETDVAERVIEYHFLPDLIGNLRAFSRQETRCLDCGEKYRRMPLTGDCRECGGRVNLTVHRGSVNKYMDTAIQVAEEFDCRPYTKQRLEVLEKSLESVFENDKNKASKLGDFM
jgi:DNA polymerase II large subunit